jgi:acyl-CoA thioester hydrolase
MAEFETRVRVRYAETDQMGVVYHANYLVWMDVARVEFCRNLGFAYREMEQDGVVIVVVEARCRYLQPARFDDEIIILIRATESTVKSLRFEYEMRREEDGRKVATGETMHLYLDKQNFRPTRLPQKYHAAFGVNFA